MGGTLDFIKNDEEVHLNCFYKKNSQFLAKNQINLQINNLKQTNKSASVSSNNFKNNRFDIKIVKCKWENEEATMILISDITQKVYIERMKQIQEYKNQMLSTVTHNLKTPLNGLMVFIQSAIINNKQKSVQDQLSLALKNSKLLLFMINDLLDYSRMQSQKAFDLCFSKFDIYDVLYEIKSLLQSQIKQKKLNFIIDIQISEQQRFIINDKVRLQQILLNFIQNSIKFTLKGQIKVTVYCIPQKINQIYFSILDTGIGVSENKKQNLFKIYGNALFNIKNKKHGVGLGLSVCKKLISQLGEKKSISVESIKNKGTKFTFSIYKKHPKDNKFIMNLISYSSLHEIQNNLFIHKVQNNYNCILKCTIQKQKNIIQDKYTLNTKDSLTIHQCILELQKIFWKKTNILIVDDVICNITCLKILLKPLKNLNIDEAYNGKEAVEKIQKNNNYDLIFMDINMPILDGFQATLKIKEMINNKSINFTSVIIVSAFNDQADIEKSFKMGASEYISKPIQIQNLLSIFQNIKLPHLQI
ncbi:hypothetical protein IMG5_138970 [Ichthyophthirius multifiliis]|uniref:Histidine kinase n=1 Tax=Ichthyophthirius multifiliis TaxID=5932 RepID=G0QX76_ICHMU|nr:hypothetical protein IMG5_138970 [Ichthyophthirius multifiliis]EGR30178.1 hypothetical protein IMG5_138970 [Ichthyophthirius multifiliis]|eukprot:XP_004031414.1 hypothetical protein IMG5_138970 [Ichthyophthirius multifiliis]